ncbi:hypothetical protein ACWGH3_39535, partial [Streptomyces sp. NPDC054884]
MGILMHEDHTRAYRSIERGKSRLSEGIRTGQELSALTIAKCEISTDATAAANYLFRLYDANSGRS